MQDNDRLSIGRIAQLYDQLPVAGDLQEALSRVRSELNSFLDSPTDLAISEKGNLSYREVLEMFVYGDLAHSNEKHARAIADLRTTPYFGLFKAEFMRALNAVLATAKEVRQLNERAVSALRPG